MAAKMHSHSNTRLKSSPFFNLKTLSAAVISAVLLCGAQVANAAGLGKLTVLSSLGQPLHAEIELTSVEKEEAGALVPKLASVEAFKQANIDFNPVLFSLRFAIEQRAGRQFIRVTSSQPVNEPYVDMLLELGGANSRLVREYTFLLDPPDLRSSQTEQTQIQVQPQIQPQIQPQAEAERPAKPKPLPSAATSATPESKNEDNKVAVREHKEYKVVKGDYLSKIANRSKAEGVSLDQMLVALYRANPKAFIDNNINRLRSGQILSIPDAAAAGNIDSKEARRIVIAQAADFNSYRSKLAAHTAESEPQKSTESKQSTTGKIISKVEEQAAPAGESNDKLKLSKANIAPNAEDSIAKEKALTEANTRIKELEKNLGDLQQLLEIKNKQMAAKQAELSEPKAEASKPVEPPAPVAPVAPMASAPETPAVPEQQKPAETPVEKPVATQPTASVAPAVPVAPVAPPPEPSIADALLENPFTLPAAGLLAAIFGGAGFYALRRKRQSKRFEDSIISDSRLRNNSLFGSDGGQRIDTNSVFDSNFAPSVSHLDSNEVDPVAEADVYIAYGREEQALAILVDALRTQPERHAIRVKMLEIYANRKDLKSFEVLATELYALTKGEGDEWKQAVALGLGIDPENPLYAFGKSSEDAKDADIAAAQPPEPDLDALIAMETDHSLESLDTIEDSTKMTEEQSPVTQAAEPAASTNELDFDLDGLDLDQPPNTIPRPPLAEPQAPIEEINFDFLEEKSPAAEADKKEEKIEEVEPVLEAAAEMPAMDFSPMEMDIPLPVPKEEVAPETSIDDLAAILSEIPNLPVTPVAEPAPATIVSKPEELDFDLSDIALELNPSEAGSALAQGMDNAGADAGGEYSNQSEMATKLDLAAAYQEIGDKEGARELLEEVVKGGAPEQVEKARSLLDKLG